MPYIPKFENLKIFMPPSTFSQRVYGIPGINLYIVKMLYYFLTIKSFHREKNLFHCIMHAGNHDIHTPFGPAGYH